MSLATADLPADPNALRAFALACQAELKAAELSVQLRTLEIEKLKFQIARLRRMQFGRASEQISRRIEQLALQLEELETTGAEEIAKTVTEAGEEPRRPRGKPKRKPLPDHLPRQEIVHQPDANSACICPDCGAGMARLGEDVTEVLDYVPGRFQVIRHVRPKYACKACDVITQAAAPAMPTPRGRATPAMFAHLLVSKYADHLPLYRQSEIYARDAVELDRSTLSDWVGQAVWLLAPIVDAIRRHVFAAEKLHGDDTPVPVLAPGLGRTRTGRLWVYVRDDRPFCGKAPPAAAYFFSPDRTGTHPAKHLASFSGFLQADGYAGFSALYDPAADPSRRANAAIVEVACWAHCRRKFFDVWDGQKSPLAKEAIERIATFYAIEAKARFAPPAERLMHRAETAPLLAAFFDWASKVVTRLSAKSALAEAFRYTLKRQHALSRFLTDARLEIDNNIAENAIRGIALGRKNYLFAGSDAGGERAAAMYTIMQTAKLNDVNPEAYLRDILGRIANGHPINRISELLPWQPSPSP
ncbi:MAG: IS66 family transposase [Hyphomicrobiales bacterium]|nr:IS66 family transposase [Hyphomicrobiales bacterium]